MVHHIMHTIMLKVDSIHFAEDYNILNQHEKTSWLNEAYVTAHPVEFDRLDAEEIAEKLVQDKEDVAIWKAKLGRETTARNRLYQLFLNVSIFIPILLRQVLNNSISSAQWSLSILFGPQNSFAIIPLLISILHSKYYLPDCWTMTMTLNTQFRSCNQASNMRCSALSKL
jgi:hypothetical protein